MYKTKYEYNKETEYTRPNTFEEFIELNGIMIEPLTIEAYDSLCEKMDNEKTELDTAIKKYKNTMDALGIYSLSNWGLTDQHNEYLYTYYSKV